MILLPFLGTRRDGDTFHGCHNENFSQPFDSGQRTFRYGLCYRAACSDGGSEPPSESPCQIHPYVPKVDGRVKDFGMSFGPIPTSQP